MTEYFLVQYSPPFSWGVYSQSCFGSPCPRKVASDLYDLFLTLPRIFHEVPNDLARILSLFSLRSRFRGGAVVKGPKRLV